MLARLKVRLQQDTPNMINKQFPFCRTACRTVCSALIVACVAIAMPVQAESEETSDFPKEISSAIEIDSASNKEEQAELQTNEYDIAGGGSVGSEIIVSTLPHNLSPWGMFMAADWVVKAVMIILALASLLTWTVLISKRLEIMALKRKLRKSRAAVSASRTLADAANANTVSGVGRELINAAESELQLSSDILSNGQSGEGVKEGIKERIGASLLRIEAASSKRMMVGTGVLASIGAIAPFVGLFGTVWGIMNSFIGISQAKTTNLAVVAPGIAEALLATALGLVAAIPAVIIYNYFTRKISGVKALVSDISTDVMRLVSRDLDRGVSLSVLKTSVTPVKAAVE